MNRQCWQASHQKDTDTEVTCTLIGKGASKGYWRQWCGKRPWTEGHKILSEIQGKWRHFCPICPCRMARVILCAVNVMLGTGTHGQNRKRKWYKIQCRKIFHKMNEINLNSLGSKWNVVICSAIEINVFGHLDLSTNKYLSCQLS